MIQTFIEIAPTELLQGLILSLLVIGIMIPFRLLDFPDLTAEGSYPLGGVLCASLIVTGVNPALSLIIASICAGFVGVGIVIHALAAMMIGEKIVGTNNIPKLVMAPLIGSLIYQQIQGFALAEGLAPSDLKFMTGAIVLGIIALK